MSHNPPEKRSREDHKHQHASTTKHSQRLKENGTEHITLDRQQNEPQISLHNDPTQDAYCRQQMAVLPDLASLQPLKPDTEDDPHRSPGSQLQGWSIERHKSLVKGEQSGFNPNPRRGGPRRPSPLVRGDDKNQQSHGLKITPCIDLPKRDPDGLIAGADDSRVYPTRPVLASKDVNRKLQGYSNRNRTPILPNLSKDSHSEHGESLPNKLVIDGLESPLPPFRQLKRMPTLAEEPAPLNIRKSVIARANTEAHSRSTTPEQGKTPDGRVMRSLLAAITDQLSNFSAGPRCAMEDSSAISEPLDLSGVRAAKEKPELSLSAKDLKEDSRAD